MPRAHAARHCGRRRSHTAALQASAAALAHVPEATACSWPPSHHHPHSLPAGARRRPSNPSNTAWINKLQDEADHYTRKVRAMGSQGG